ncbi:uncharacterized protein F4807DRAFT_433967 [Annulohypoxylon truncatum]|uniref:uncharacterized protein n=1 Tax=Annulohypoxylon truncatum TaxID=327061 RepID=UPI0020086D7E|nr:uncharacterized protein F4807DRAFT_433967 [Annulohypoxylon truncatum]KAI1207623.1 hypothetical protein F4807DRAFT_433967 [Annulohypoxylon truncatum]
MSVQDLARSLVAVGSTKVSDDGDDGIYTLSVRDGYLVEKHWLGDTIQNENVIASDANDNATASYLLTMETRLVIFIDQDHAIRCYSYDDDIEEWEEVPLASVRGIETSPDSKVSAIVGLDGGLAISYQDANGCLAVIINAGGEEWKTFRHLQGKPMLGTPQVLEVIDDTMYLFYVERDVGISYLAFDPHAGAWQANSVPNTKFDTIIDNFIVVKDFDTGNFQSYILTGGSLWSVNGEEKTFLGNVGTNGKLIPSDNAQAGFSVKWRGARKVRVSRRKITIWY